MYGRRSVKEHYCKGASILVYVLLPHFLFMYDQYNFHDIKTSSKNKLTLVVHYATT